MSPALPVTRCDHPETLARAAAARIAGIIAGALRDRGRATIALSGGATPARAYELLGEATLDWAKVSVTLVDDRWADPGDARSNRNLLNRTLFRGRARAARFTPLCTGDPTPEAGAPTTEAALATLDLPFDLVVLGMGEDGHAASLFPGGDRLAEALDMESGRLALPMRAAGAPEPRITMTLPLMLRARRILLLIAGSAKQAALARALEDGPVAEMPIRAFLRQTGAPLEVLSGDDPGDAAESAESAATQARIDAAFANVLAARRALAGRSALSLFETDPGRFEKFSARLDDMLLDFSKTGIDDAALSALLALARAAGVAARRDAMFAGEAINETEGRAVLHVALRAAQGDEFAVDGKPVTAEVLAARARCLDFAEGVRTGAVAACDGAPFSDIVNIGIGGSDLGPAMATLALAPFHDGPRTHFVSNIDGAHLADTLKGLDPARTLVLVASKTFTTIETMTNARSAMAWMRRALGDRAGGHFAAISTARGLVEDFGVAPERMFGFWDWVGGRYSLWSAIGLSLMIAVGRKDFLALLDGARAMDRHFVEAEPARNLPMLLALVGIWHRNACGFATRAALPYDQRLARLPAYLQQLDMESNGKTARLGPGLAGDTGPVVWGEPGTNGQHAFYQLIHQGTAIVPCEFLAAAEGFEPELAHHHQLLLANCLAQSEALLRGRSLAEAAALMRAGGASEAEIARLAPHRAFGGDRPSVTLLYRRLDPFTLGRIIALYEHRVFVEGAIWGVNSFDQWGVELGKVLAGEIAPMLETGAAGGKDGSTAGLIGWLRKPV